MSNEGQTHFCKYVLEQMDEKRFWFLMAMTNIPSSDVVRHDSGVVGDGKVSILVSLGLGLEEDGKLTQGGLEFFLERLVGCLREERLLLKDGPDAHGLLKHDDGSGQVHAEVHHDPVNTFSHVLLLLYNEPKCAE